MNILVIGGTRFFGIPMVNALLDAGHDVTIATRGIAHDDYGNKVKRIVFDRANQESVQKAFHGVHYDVVIDKIAYCSNDIKCVVEAIDCDKYIHMSTTAVYNPKHMNIFEEEYDGLNNEIIWCDRNEFSYDEVKRQAENALCKAFEERKRVVVRYPVVLGEDDYTKRLFSYVEHIINAIPMNIDNMDAQMSYIHSKEAGEFIAFLVDKDFSGAINGCASGTISLREIINYVEEKIGLSAILSSDGSEMPYNGEPEFSINTEKAKGLGYSFSDLKNWIFDLLDYYIDQVSTAH